jgi:hypothetical protein
MESGTNQEKAGAASAFYWSFGQIRDRPGSPREDAEELRALWWHTRFGLPVSIWTSTSVTLRQCTGRSQAIQAIATPERVAVILKIPS